MATVQDFCDRAMVIHDGELQYIGEPEEAALRYYRLNFGGRRGAPREGTPRRAMSGSSRRGSRTRRGAGRQRGTGGAVRLPRDLRGASRSPRPVFGFHFLNVERLQVFGFNLNLSARASRIWRGPARALSGTSKTPFSRGVTTSGHRCPAAAPGRPRAPPAGAAGLRRLRHETEAGSVSVDLAVKGRGDDVSPHRAPGRPRSLGVRRRLAPCARAALPDRLDRIQARLLRHGARVPVVGLPAAAAVRGPARGVLAPDPAFTFPTTPSSC